MEIVFVVVLIALVLIASTLYSMRNLDLEVNDETRQAEINVRRRK